MNRRDFFKFAGKGIAALGVVAVTGLPDVDEVKEEVEWEFNIPKYNKDAKIALPDLADFWPIAGNPEGNEFPGLDKIIRTGYEEDETWQKLTDSDTFYIGGEFTAMPRDVSSDTIAIYVSDEVYWKVIND